MEKTVQTNGTTSRTMVGNMGGRCRYFLKSGDMFSAFLKKLIFSIALMLCVQSTAFADEAANSRPFDDEVLSLGYLDISVATISEIEFKKQYDSLPPLPVAKLDIEEAIRGTVPVRQSFSSLLYYHERSKYKPSDQILEWEGWTLADLIGKKFIVITNGSDIVQLYPYSASLREHIISNMPPAYLDDGALAFLFFVLIGITLVPLRYSSKFNTRAPGILLAVQVILYIVYEWGTPSYYNIRADLLFIIPAVFINLVLTISYYFKLKYK